MGQPRRERFRTLPSGRLSQADALAAFTGSYCDRPFGDDRFQVRNRGHVDFETAQKKAEKLAADPWPKAIYLRLVDAIVGSAVDKIVGAITADRGDIIVQRDPEGLMTGVRRRKAQD